MKNTRSRKSRGAVPLTASPWNVKKTIYLYKCLNCRESWRLWIRCDPLKTSNRIWPRYLTSFFQQRCFKQYLKKYCFSCILNQYGTVQYLFTDTVQNHNILKRNICLFVFVVTKEHLGFVSPMQGKQKQINRVRKTGSRKQGPENRVEKPGHHLPESIQCITE